jgi:pimeloyl-ACP methyl ester carboxylesterase
MQYKYTRAAFGRSSFIEVEKNVRLHIIDLGEGDPVVFIHGMPFSNAMFEYQYQYLIKAGYRAIGISLRGFGLSDRPYGKYNYDVFADDLKMVLEELEIQKAVLCGFSTGAATAIRYAVRYQGAHISKLVLVSAAVPFLFKEENSAEANRQHMKDLIGLINTDRPEFFRTFTRLSAGGSPFITSNVSQWFNNNYERASSYAIEQNLILLRDAELGSDLDRINVYTAIFHGRHDNLLPFSLAEKLNDAIPRSWFIPFENSGHALFLEEMEKFNATLLRFIHLASIVRPQLSYHY